MLSQNEATSDLFLIFQYIYCIPLLKSRFIEIKHFHSPNLKIDQEFHFLNIFECFLSVIEKSHL
jgi:hypothetical protein